MTNKDKKLLSNSLRVICLLVLDYLAISKLPGSNVEKVMFETKFAFDTNANILYWFIQVLCKISAGILAGVLAYANVSSVFDLLKSILINPDEVKDNNALPDVSDLSISNVKDHNEANVYFNTSTEPCNSFWVEYDWQGLKIFSTQINPNTLVEGVEYIACIDTRWYEANGFSYEYIEDFANEFISYETRIDIRGSVAQLNILTVPSLECHPYLIPRITIVTKEHYEQTKKEHEYERGNKIVEFNKDSGKDEQ